MIIIAKVASRIVDGANMRGEVFIIKTRVIGTQGIVELPQITQRPTHLATQDCGIR